MNRRPRLLTRYPLCDCRETSRRIVLMAFCALPVVGLLVANPAAAHAEEPTPVKVSVKVELVVGNWLPGERDGAKEGETGTQDKAAAKSPLDFPFGVDFDSVGNTYIVEMSGGYVRRLGTNGQLTKIAGTGAAGYSGDGGPATEATFREMHNLAIGADDNLYIADSANHAVRHIDMKTGTITSLAGNGQQGFDSDHGTAGDARFKKTICIAFDPAKKNLFVADIYNIRIRAIDVAAGTVHTVAGNGQSGVPKDGSLAVKSPLVDPRAVAVGLNGNVYLLERAGHALRVIDREGKIRTVAGSGKKGYRDGPALEAQFDGPKHLCVDDRGNVYIADDVNQAIRKYDPETGTVTTLLGRGHGDAAIKLNKPHGVCFYQGKLYVVDSGNNRVLRVTAPSN